MELQEIINDYNNTRNKLMVEKATIEEKIAKLKQKLEKNEEKRPYIVQDVLRPLAKRIMARCGFKCFEIYGPFGISCETSVYFANDGKMDNIDICHVETWSLTLQWAFDKVGNLHHLEYWTGETTNDYAKGTIGEMNGLNNIYKELPMDVDEIIKLLRHSTKNEK